ncbi:unnamed protein product [Phytophthora fragariaefolia]|uniref:Unnamed protein product n=1 Tax=Phytophthora fragariaefolia TaxID=1490495 RepID=A0A9W6XE52_9STRA|nr:unnamed protein product [Phytophthora fragariaefolia]
MLGIKPDVHYIRKFGALAYVYVPVTPGRRKRHHNAKVGYVLIYVEAIVGSEDATSHTAMVDTNGALPSGLGEREEEADEPEIIGTIAQNSQSDVDEVDDNVEGITDVVANAEVEAVCERYDHGVHVEEVEHADSQQTASNEHQGPAAYTKNDSKVHFSADMEPVVHADSEPVGIDDKKPDEIAASNVAEQDVVSDAGTLGSLVADEDLDGDDEESGDKGLTVASIFASEDDGDRNSSNMLNLEVDFGNTKKNSNLNTSSVQHEIDHEVIGTSALMGSQPKQTGQRTRRGETQSKDERVEHEAAKTEPKKTQRGLREYSQRKMPSYFNDYVVKAVQAIARALDKNGKPTRGEDIRIPWNRREMMRSTRKEFFRMAEMEEMAALKARGVIQEITSKEVPKDALPIKTMWVHYQRCVSRREGNTVLEEMSGETYMPLNIEEKAAPKKLSASQVDDDNDDEAEDPGEPSGQIDSNSGEGSGADEMSGDEDEIEEEEEDEEDDEKTEDVIVPAFLSDRKIWLLFEESLLEYMRSTQQVLVLNENINIKRHNDALRPQTRTKGSPTTRSR